MADAANPAANLQFFQSKNIPAIGNTSGNRNNPRPTMRSAAKSRPRERRRANDKEEEQNNGILANN
jgi:hypothetical protein